MENSRFLMISAIFLFGFLGTIDASGFGKCPVYPSLQKFNMTKFLGRWNEIERSFYLPEIASGCTSIHFERMKNDTTDLEVAVKTLNTWTNQPSVSIGTATPENEKSSIMNVQLMSRLPAAIARFLPGSGRYQVLYTDYDNFAILWSCSNFGILHTDQIWLLGRDKNDFDVQTRQKIYNALEQLGLDSDRLTLSKNAECPALL